VTWEGRAISAGVMAALGLCTFWWEEVHHGPSQAAPPGSLSASGVTGGWVWGLVSLTYMLFFCSKCLKSGGAATGLCGQKGSGSPCHTWAAAS